jgi:glucose-6-phosphate isomerase
LHSTGQYHKGGPNQGVFLQIVSGEDDDLIIPGREFGYRQLIDSQASGDAKVLSRSGSKVLVVRLSSPEVGISELIGALS